jgi:hypothetical protein
MNKVTEINNVLTECAEQLAVCAPDVNDIKALKDERLVLKLGKAIAEINEVRSALYKIQPELKPELWDTPPTSDHYAAWFEEAKRVAEEYCFEGNPLEAIKTYESFIYIGPTEEIEAQARQEIIRLKNEYGV